MKICNIDAALSIAEDSIGFMENISHETWGEIYDRHRDAQGGFPGIRTMVASWILEFYEACPDKGTSFEWIQALDSFSEQLTKYAADNDTVTSAYVASLARDCIAAYAYDAGEESRHNG